MEKLYTYEAEDKNKYQMLFHKYEKKIKISFTNQSSSDLEYTSEYQLDELNERFGKVIHFKEINVFYQCLIDNIRKKSLIIKPPYKNIITSIWKIFPIQKTNQTFTLMFSKLFNKNISLIFYSNYTKSEEVVKEIERQLEINQKSKIEDNFYSKITYDSYFIQNMYFLLNKYSNEEKKLKDFMKIIELNQTIIEFRTLLIFIDEDNLIDSLMKVINKYYKNQIFIVIFTNKVINNLKIEIEEKIDKLSETKKSYFDMNNIFIYENNEGHKKILMTILKIFSYFNQLGDWFYIHLFESGLNIEGLEEEVKKLFYTHYFNILLYGRTGTGKSTFINKIMGEKKSFTLKIQSAGTERNNFYIHKKYPIKIIDVCGFAEGNEGKEILERLNLIYKKNPDNIIIDKSMNDIFHFYEDKRNNIHLLLYFNVYNDKYDVLPGELPVVYDAKDKNIPIIFIINKCKDEIFDDEDEKKDLLDEIIEVRKNTDFENNKTFFINCINGNGFKELLTGIFEHYQNSLISKENLEKINENIMNKEDFQKLFENSFFLKNIEPQNILLHESLLTSIKDIKELIIKLSGYYSDNLGFFQSLNFYFFYKIYNNIKRNSEINFFPLLTDLVKKIYSNFGFEKNENECNDFIKAQIGNYFGFNSQGTAPLPNNFNLQEFKTDYNNLVKLFWNSKSNYMLDIENMNLNTENKIEEKVFELTNNNSEIDSERILLLIKRDFGLDNTKRDATSNEKIIQKLFYISYTCNQLISFLCGEINQYGFKYKSIYNFYYTVSKSYNDAINGFIEIQKNLEDNKKKLKEYIQSKKNKKNQENDEENNAAPNINYDYDKDK